MAVVHEDLRCRLTIVGVNERAVKVAAVQAFERLSDLFRYTVVVATTSDDAASLVSSLGASASFVLERGGAVERVIHGIVSEVLPDGAYVGRDQVRTTLVLEPRLANLRYSGGYRIFQHKSVKDIIEELVKAESIDLVWRARPEPPVREYRTQFNESDLAFIRRLAAGEGLHFFFEHADDKTTVVFTNTASGFREIAGSSTLPFRDVEGAVAGEYVRAIQRAERVRTGAVEHRDYDFRNPRVALVARGETSGPQSEANAKRREWRDYPGGFDDPEQEGALRAKMRLEEFRSDASILTGSAYCPRLQAGKKFSLAGHRDTALNGALVVTEVAFSIEVQGMFATSGAREPRASGSMTRFSAAPAGVPLRPRRLPRPHAPLQTARVVGTKEGDPFVDDYGRIKIQFVWDRDGKFDEHSSCWVRMATPVAHGDEGFWSAHRVGSEVLVDFLDGDIDSPIVIGAVYNGRERQPYKQPGKVTRSSWKVRGIPGGTGYNEITFENQSGDEQILLHAQKDLNETILHSHSAEIGVDQTISVGADRSLSVGKDQTISVAANETTTIGANRTTTIGANRTTKVTADESLTVMGSATKMVATTDTVLVGAARSLTAGSEAVTVGSRVKTVAADESTTVGGGRTETVGGDESVTVGGQRSTSTGADDSLSVGKTYAITVAKDFRLKVGDDAEIGMTKDGHILLKTGEASIAMAKDGTITVKGKNVTVEASSDVKIKGDNVVLKGSKVTAN